MVLVTVSLSPRREDRAPGTHTPVSEHIQPAKTLDRIGLSHSLPRSCQHPPHGGCGTTRLFHHPAEAPPRRGLPPPVAQLHRKRRQQHTPHNTTPSHHTDTGNRYRESLHKGTLYLERYNLPVRRMGGCAPSL